MLIMKPPRRFSLKLLLKIVVILASLWMFTLVRSPQSKWNPSYFLTDGVPGSSCDCLKVLSGDDDEIEKAKLLSIRRDYRTKVQVTDDFYINATQDCTCVQGFFSFVELTLTIALTL